MSNYFVQLTESGQTVNLAQIASINWQELPAGWEESDCTATITLASGYYVCITPADAQELWEALSRYNTRMGQALAALPTLANALNSLLAELRQTTNEPQDYRANTVVKNVAGSHSPAPASAGSEQNQRPPNTDPGEVGKQTRVGIKPKEPVAAPYPTR